VTQAPSVLASLSGHLFGVHPAVITSSAQRADVRRLVRLSGCFEEKKWQMAKLGGTTGQIKSQMAT
jgi:hypothetical protein